MDGGMEGSLNAVICRAPVELTNKLECVDK